MPDPTAALRAVLDASRETLNYSNKGSGFGNREALLLDGRLVGRVRGVDEEAHDAGSLRAGGTLCEELGARPASGRIFNFRVEAWAR